MIKGGTAAGLRKLASCRPWFWNRLRGGVGPVGVSVSLLQNSRRGPPLSVT